MHYHLPFMYQGQHLLDVTLEDSRFAAHYRSGAVAGLGFFSAEARHGEGGIVWLDKPREVPGTPVDSGTLRALDALILENLRPYCSACYERVKTDGSSLCWPCAQHYGAYRD